MACNMKKHEYLVKSATFVLFILGMIYVGYVNEIIKGKIQDIHRFIVCAVFIYGAFKLSQDIPLLIYKKLFSGGGKAGGGKAR